MLQYFDLNKIKLLFVYDKTDPLVFTSSLFLFLFFALLLLYRLFYKSKPARIYLLIIFSIFFYYKASGIYFLFLFVVSFSNYFMGKWIGGGQSRSRRLSLFLVSILLNIGLLIYFKYTNFFIQIINDVRDSHIAPLDIFLPLGISFITFKALSYVIEIYLKNIEPVKSITDFTLFIFYFPTVQLGPIERASNFLPQVEEDINITNEMIGTAVFLIMSGLIKKVVIADYIGINFVDRVFEVPLRFTGVENLIAAYAYTLQLYTDFSGYTDMAMGISLLFGYRLTDNFNVPFKAVSIADFWRRWHITLSSWCLDYIFKPLQIKFRGLDLLGNALALFITFLVIGLWHGPSWTYIAFGAIHGTYYVFSIFTKKLRKKFYKKTNLTNSKTVKFFQWFFTFQLVVFAFIVFRSQSLPMAADMLNQMINFFHGEVFMQFVAGYKLIFCLIIGGYLVHFLPEVFKDKARLFVINASLYAKVAMLVVVIWIVVQFRFADLQPFLYFKF
jgi:D-alanyl-lipoteichoic acid acyltransferase DltB (MBOAT superfamily)